MTKKLLRLYLIILAVLCLTICTKAKGEGNDSVVTQGFQRVTAAEITFEWRVEGKQLEFIVTAPTPGWVAAGFNPSKLMQDANFILACVKDGEVEVRDDFGTWFTSHEADEALGGESNVTVLEGSEKDGKTRVSLAVPLDSGDEYDRVLVPGQTYTVLLAYGGEDDFSSVHRKKAKIEIKI